jgi:signal transduction histidine kinase
MRQGGSGLGLAISRELIAAHGGVLELVSTDEAGTRFRITVPDQALLLGSLAAR